MGCADHDMFIVTCDVCKTTYCRLCDGSCPNE